MCRADVAPAAQAPLARVLVEMARELARLEGLDPASVRIGPVDFGTEHHEEITDVGGEPL